MLERRINRFRTSFLLFLAILSCSVKASDIWNEDSSKISQDSDGSTDANPSLSRGPSAEFQINEKEELAFPLQTQTSFNSLESAGFSESGLEVVETGDMKESPYSSGSSEEAAAIAIMKAQIVPPPHPDQSFKPVPNILMMTPDSESSEIIDSGRPRASSVSRHVRRDLHVSFNNSQSEEMHTIFPDFDILDTPENRAALHAKLLRKAESGEFLYFAHLKSYEDKWDVAKRLETPNTETNCDEALMIRMDELNSHSKTSFLFASLKGDSPEIFASIMEWKGIRFEDLHASPHLIRSFAKLSKSNAKAKPKESVLQSNFGLHHGRNRFSPSSYPPRGKSLLDTPSEDDVYYYDDDDDEEEEDGGTMSDFYNLSSDGHDSDREADDGLTVCETVFGRAVELDAVKIVRFMLENGVRDYIEAVERNSLHVAITSKLEAMVSLLLQYRVCNVDQIDGALKTPLMLAIESDSIAIVAELIKANASLITTDFKMRSPLHFAAINGNINILALLKDALHTRYDQTYIQTLIGIPDSHGKTIVDCARNGNVRNFILHEIGGFEV